MTLVAHVFNVSHALLLCLDAHVKVMASNGLFIGCWDGLGIHGLKPIFNHFEIA